MWRAGSPKDSPWYAENCNAAHPISGPQHTNRTCSEPASPCCAGRIISQTLTKSTSTGCSTHTHACEPRGRRSKSSTKSTKPTGPTKALGRFADLYATGQIPEYHEIVDTIIAWGQEILAYHSCRRASNGPIEGINNLLQVLRRVAHGFTNYDNYAARGVLVT